MAPPEQVTQLLHRWRGGDEGALARLLPLVYEELRRLARRHLRGERPDHTLEPTALVHEAYLRLAAGGGRDWRDRVHFYATAAQLMRQVLVDHARAHRAAKRGGRVVKVPLDEARHRPQPSLADVVDLDEALRALEALDPRKSRIIELRFFGGLTLEETGEVLGLAVPTVVKEARLARAWLVAALAERRDGRP